MAENTLVEDNRSTSKKNLEKWLAAGKTLNPCINEGCKNTVTIRHWTNTGVPSCKTECSRCQGARTSGKEIKDVTFHKKKYCQNKDSILGFKCPMDQTRYDEFPSDIYQMDHYDGNHDNNSRENLITFCSICHTRKGKMSGDFNAFKPSSRIHKS
jgi:5-methylcytosine-specific restriction endonuclease McrA